MRKLFTYLAVAALVAVACEDMYGPVETPTAPDKAGSVKIQVDTLGDDTLAFTISPEAIASYYSYVVTQGPAAELDSSAVYQCKVDGLIKGTFNAAEDSVATLTLGGLAPNTAYTIYAVAGSPQGIPGSVAVKEVTTTDNVTIDCVDYDDSVTDSTIVLTFSEQVFLGKGEITAAYYAANLKYAEMGTVPAVADSIIVDGNTVSVQFAGLPHGAYYAVSWPEGMFTDSKGNKIAAMPSILGDEGIYSRKDTVAFALPSALSEEQRMFSDWQTSVFSVSCDSTLAVAGKGAVTANYLTPGHTLTIDMALEVNYMFGANAEGQSGIMMVCPEAPTFGTTVVFSFEQDTFRDIWGNPNKAADYSTLYAYDYTIADVLGTYEYTIASAYDYSEYTGNLVIAESDDPAKGNVMFTVLWDYECDENVYATFNPTMGVLTIPSKQKYCVGTTYDFGFSTFDAYGAVLDTPAVLRLVESGHLAFDYETYFIGDGVIDKASGAYLGSYDLYYFLDAVVTEGDATLTASPAAKVLRTSLK